MNMTIHSHPSLRFQAHWAFPQGLPTDQKCQKSLPARPTPTHGKMDNAANLKYKLIKNNKGQLVTRNIKNWAESTKDEHYNIKSTT